ncbi:MAG: alanine--glyoxylate aminotransferase family protein [Candidatus Thermoplasmatota archaeon]
MPFDPMDNTFLLAGPVKMHPRVLRAMAVPAVAHRDPGFVDVNKRMQERLREVFQTSAPIVSIAGSGTAGMDAAAQSMLKKTDKAVALDNGKFGNRFCSLASLYGTSTTLTAPWGQPIDLDKLNKTLQEVRPKALFLTHNESSVGFTQPLERISKMAHDVGALVVADCITSIGGMDVPVDKWGIDIAIVGSQKCLGMPAGLVFVSVNEKAQAALHKDNGYYLNLTKYIKKAAENDTPFTPAIPLHLAAIEALDIIHAEGLQNRITKVRKQASATRAAFEAMGLELFVPAGYRSDTVTAVRYPAGVDDSKVRKTLKQDHNVIIAGGQDGVKGVIFRLGHMGTVTNPELVGGIAAVESALLANGAKLKRGAWVEAWNASIA